MELQKRTAQGELFRYVAQGKREVAYAGRTICLIGLRFQSERQTDIVANHGCMKEYSWFVLLGFERF